MDKNLMALMTVLGSEVVTSRVRVRALLEILNEKGLVTKDEYTSKFEEVSERDFESVKEELFKELDKLIEKE